MEMFGVTKMDPGLWSEYDKNAGLFCQKIQDICEKYANVEDPGFDLCLKTMTYKTRQGAIPAESVEAKRKLQYLENFAEQNLESLKDKSNTEDSLVTCGSGEDSKNNGHSSLVRVMEISPGQSLLVSSSLLSLPEDQDPELESTFSSQSDMPTLQDLYPNMLTQIHKAYERQQVSEVASSLRRKYQRQRCKAKRLNAGQSFMNSSTIRPSPIFQTPSVAPKGCPEANFETYQSKDAGSAQRSSLLKCHTSQGAGRGQSPVRVMSFSTPPSSGPSSPSDSVPELNQTYVVETLLPVPHTSQCSQHQVRKQKYVNKASSLYAHAGASYASQSVDSLCDAGNHTRMVPSPKRRNYKDCLSSPSKVNSRLRSHSHHHHDQSGLMNYSSPCQKQLLSPRLALTLSGHSKTLMTSPVKPQVTSWSGETMPQQSSHSHMGGTGSSVLTGGITLYKRRSLRGDAPLRTLSHGKAERECSNDIMGEYRLYKQNLHREMTRSFKHSGGAVRNPGCSVLIRDHSPYEQQFLSRSAPEDSPSTASSARPSFIHSPHLISGSRLSSLPQHPEVYTSPRYHHDQQQHRQDFQENRNPSPSKLEALRRRRRSFSGPRHTEHSPARRLSSSFQHVNKKFRQLYHQHICQQRSRSSLFRHSSSCCLCEQKAEGSSACSGVTATTPTRTTNSQLAALSLTPVRRPRIQSGLAPLLKLLQRKQQAASSLLQRQYHQKSQQQPLYHADECDDTVSLMSEMSDETQSPDLYLEAQISSGARRPHHHTTGSSNYSSPTLAGLGLASPHARLSKRRCLFEPKESPSLKRFRESTQPQLSPSKPSGFPQHHPHMQWEGDDADSGEEEEMMAPVGNGLSEEHLTRSRALLLQCPSPRFLRAAMRPDGGSRAGRSLGTHPHASARE